MNTERATRSCTDLLLRIERMLKYVRNVSGLSNENTMTSRTNRTSRPQTEIARVAAALKERAAAPRLMTLLRGGGFLFPPTQPRSTQRSSMRDQESPPRLARG